MALAIQQCNFNFDLSPPFFENNIVEIILLKAPCAGNINFLFIKKSVSNKMVFIA